MSAITNEFVVSTLTSAEEFPVKLDDVWEWLGYSRKDAAVRAFNECGMTETLDFAVFHKTVEDASKFGGKRVDTEIAMTVDCFKMWAMMARTDKGKEIRLYYLRVEREYKADLDSKVKAAKALPPMWKENRLLLSDVEPSYQRWCRAASFNASFVTNYIYVAVCNGDDAAALRLKETIDGSPSIAANHISQPELVEEVARIKNRLTKYTRKFSYYKDAVNQAIGDLEHARK